MKKKLIWRTKLPPTILKTMKLTLVFMLACIMHVSANVFSQNTRVSLACNQETVKDIFKKISNQTNLDFFYSGNEINSNERKTVNFDNEQLDVVMKTILGNKYDYSVIDNLIIIQPANPLKSQDSEKILIKGIVKDADNLPLPGVSVCVKGTTNGVATDLDGTYKFSFEKTKSPIIIEFSFVGMKTVAVKYTGQKVIDVVLVYNSEELEEVVVTNNGYQKIDRRLFTGSATKISAEDAKVDGVPDVGRMLEGKVAGVSVQNVSGTFGAAPKIRVRGASSIYGDTKPLWVVDGIILEDVVDIAPDDLSSVDAKTLISSSIAGLNADDIEDFQVLKDASATAMYGARAMNGVICITTKKGVPGKTTFRVSSEMTVRTNRDTRIMIF